MHNLHITEKSKILTLDIKDLYVNMPKQGIIQSTSFWLDKNNTSKKIKEQIIRLLKIIIEQNYFQYNDQFFKPKNGIAMGSPISCRTSAPEKISYLVPKFEWFRHVTIFAPFALKRKI